MTSNYNRQVDQARDMDRLSTALIDAGIGLVKRNPVPSALYVLGLFLCLFFNGLDVQPKHQQAYEQSLESIDYDAYYISRDDFYRRKSEYERSLGWFWSCDRRCQSFKTLFNEASINFQQQEKLRESKLSEAKSHVGLFSKYGIAETRNLFWNQVRLHFFYLFLFF